MIVKDCGVREVKEGKTNYHVQKWLLVNGSTQDHKIFVEGCQELLKYGRRHVDHWSHDGNYVVEEWERTELTLEEARYRNGRPG